MKTEKKSTVVFVIELSEEEASMLKAMVQNPLGDGEPKNWADFRLMVWNALSEVK